MRYNMVNNSQSRCVGISFYTKGAFFMRKKQFKAESKRLLDLMVNSIYTHKAVSYTHLP